MVYIDVNGSGFHTPRQLPGRSLIIFEGALSISIRVKVQGNVYLANVGVAPRSSFCFASSKEVSWRSCRMDVWQAGRFIVTVPGPSLSSVCLEMSRKNCADSLCGPSMMPTKAPSAVSAADRCYFD